MIWQIATQTGWTVRYILRGVNYQTLLLMLADAPRYIPAGNADKNKKKSKKTTEGFFRSLMEKQ